MKCLYIAAPQNGSATEHATEYLRCVQMAFVFGWGPGKLECLETCLSMQIWIFICHIYRRYDSLVQVLFVIYHQTKPAEQPIRIPVEFLGDFPKSKQTGVEIALSKEVCHCRTPSISPYPQHNSSVPCGRHRFCDFATFSAVLIFMYPTDTHKIQYLFLLWKRAFVDRFLAFLQGLCLDDACVLQTSQDTAPSAAAAAARINRVLKKSELQAWQRVTGGLPCTDKSMLPLDADGFIFQSLQNKRLC